MQVLRVHPGRIAHIWISIGVAVAALNVKQEFVTIVNSHDHFLLISLWQYIARRASGNSPGQTLSAAPYS